MEKVISASGFEINKCCASCTNKQYSKKQRSDEVVRKCALTGEEVSERNYCDEFHVRPGLLNL